jgi:hypothetical protein
MQEWGVAVSKATALEEMYLIYQAVRNYLADSEPWGELGLEDLVASYRSFCQREPLGGMFLESVLEELMEPPRDAHGIITNQKQLPPPRNRMLADQGAPAQYRNTAARGSSSGTFSGGTTNTTPLLNKVCKAARSSRSSSPVCNSW